VAQLWCASSNRCRFRKDLKIRTRKKKGKIKYYKEGKINEKLLENECNEPPSRGCIPLVNPHAALFPFAKVSNTFLASMSLNNCKHPRSSVVETRLERDTFGVRNGVTQPSMPSDCSKHLEVAPSLVHSVTPPTFRERHEQHRGIQTRRM